MALPMVFSQFFAQNIIANLSKERGGTTSDSDVTTFAAIDVYVLAARINNKAVSPRNKILFL
jgi:hypothetical protein